MVGSPVTITDGLVRDFFFVIGKTEKKLIKQGTISKSRKMRERSGRAEATSIWDSQSFRGWRQQIGPYVFIGLFEVFGFF